MLPKVLISRFLLPEPHMALCQVLLDEHGKRRELCGEGGDL
jgi:hypothetical protein